MVKVREPAPPSFTRSPSRSDTLKPLPAKRLLSTVTSTEAPEPFGLGGIGSPSGVSDVVGSSWSFTRTPWPMLPRMSTLNSHSFTVPPVSVGGTSTARPSPGALRMVRLETARSPPPVARKAVSAAGVTPPSAVASRVAPLPRMVRSCAPVNSTADCSSTVRTPRNRMVVTSGSALARSMAWRNDPGPAFRALVTNTVSAAPRQARTARRRPGRGDTERTSDGSRSLLQGRDPCRTGARPPRSRRRRALRRDARWCRPSDDR